VGDALASSALLSSFRLRQLGLHYPPARLGDLVQRYRSELTPSRLRFSGSFCFALRSRWLDPACSNRTASGWTFAPNTVLSTASSDLRIGARHSGCSTHQRPAILSGTHPSGELRGIIRFDLVRLQSGRHQPTSL